MLKKIYNNFFNKKNKQRKKPISCIQVELTNHCNYFCKFCPQSHGFKRPIGFMDEKLYLQIIEQANQVADSINFSFFGEPLTHPKILHFLDLLKQRNFQVVMNTNLSYATKNVFEKLIEIKIDDLRLSIDANSSKVYDQVRPLRTGHIYLDLDGKPTQQNRFSLIQKKARYWHSLSNHGPTRHVFTVNSINKNETEEFIRKWQPLLSKNDVILVKSVISYGGKIIDKVMIKNPCNIWNLDMLTVDWQGNVSPCNLDTGMELIVGNVRHQKLIDILHNDKSKELRKLSLEKKIEPCISCFDSNNWTKNLLIKKSDKWENKYWELYT